MFKPLKLLVFGNIKSNTDNILENKETRLADATTLHNDKIGVRFDVVVSYGASVFKRAAKKVKIQLVHR